MLMFGLGLIEWAVLLFVAGIAIFVLAMAAHCVLNRSLSAKAKVGWLITIVGLTWLGGMLYRSRIRRHGAGGWVRDGALGSRRGRVPPA